MLTVTLLLPVKLHGDDARLFVRRHTELQVSPFPGLRLSGCGLTPPLRRLQWHYVPVTHVGEDLAEGEVLVTLHGLYEETLTAEEMLRQLGEGWEISPESIRVEAPPASELGS